MNQISSDFEKYGGSYLISDENYEKYINDVDNIGRSDGQFIAPSNQMDDLLQNHPDNPREWERQLGLRENSLGDSDIHRVDVYNPQDYNPRLPSSELSGSNEKFISGGKTVGGLDECVIDRFPNPERNPSVGKITNIDNVPSKDAANSLIDTKTNSPSNKVANGGGARAPNNRINGNTDNPTKSKKTSTKRGNRDNPPEPKKASRKNGNADNTSKTTDNSNSLDSASNNSTPITQEAAPTVDQKTTGATTSNHTADTAQTLTEDAAQKATEEAAQKAAEQQAEAVSSTVTMSV